MTISFRNHTLKTILRLSSASTVALALLLSFVKAPFAHVHRHDLEHRHATGLWHTHLSLLSGRGPVINADDDEDDAQSLEWAAAANDFAQPFAAVVSEAISLPAPELRKELVRRPAPRAHDPPPSHTFSSRAPPA